MILAIFFFLAAACYWCTILKDLTRWFKLLTLRKIASRFFSFFSLFHRITKNYRFSSMRGTTRYKLRGDYVQNMKNSSCKLWKAHTHTALFYPNQTIYAVKCHCCLHIETSQLICSTNQLTGFCMRATLVFNGLMSRFVVSMKCVINIDPKNSFTTFTKCKSTRQSLLLVKSSRGSMFYFTLIYFYSTLKYY